MKTHHRPLAPMAGAAAIHQHVLAAQVAAGGGQKQAPTMDHAIACGIAVMLALEPLVTLRYITARTHEIRAPRDAARAAAFGS